MFIPLLIFFSPSNDSFSPSNDFFLPAITFSPTRISENVLTLAVCFFDGVDYSVYKYINGEYFFVNSATLNLSAIRHSDSFGTEAKLLCYYQTKWPKQ